MIVEKIKGFLSQLKRYIFKFVWEGLSPVFQVFFS